MPRPRREDTPRPRSDAYVGLLVLALLAQIVGCVFLYLDWSQYPESKPPAPPSITSVPSGGGIPPAGGGAGGVPPAGGGMAGVPPAGGGMAGVPPVGGGMAGVPPAGGGMAGVPPGP